jgi:hypothetical protein
MSVPESSITHVSKHSKIRWGGTRAKALRVTKGESRVSFVATLVQADAQFIEGPEEMISQLDRIGIAVNVHGSLDDHIVGTLLSHDSRVAVAVISILTSLTGSDGSGNEWSSEDGNGKLHD